MTGGWLLWTGGWFKDHWLVVVGCLGPLAVDWWLAAGCWLLVTGCWLLAARSWLLSWAVLGLSWLLKLSETVLKGLNAKSLNKNTCLFMFLGQRWACLGTSRACLRPVLGQLEPVFGNVVAVLDLGGRRPKMVASS